MRIIAVSLCFLALTVAPATAGQPEAKQCAAGLDANSRQIFDAVLPKVAPGVKLKGELTSVVRDMVKSGKLQRADAKPAATSAAECLKLAVNK